MLKDFDISSFKKQKPPSDNSFDTDQEIKALKKISSACKTAVTGKVKPGSKDAKRRKSFCARSKGWTGERGKAARRRWKC